MAKAKQERKSWDRQEGEPVEAYSHFLAYRNLGLGRSIRAAYASAVKGGRRRNTPGTRAPGNWERESADWRWRSRAVEWDISNLQDEGREAVALYTGSLLKAVDKLFNALDKKHIKPNTWDSVQAGLIALAALIPPETVWALIRHDEQPEKPISADIKPDPPDEALYVKKGQ